MFLIPIRWKLNVVYTFEFVPRYINIGHLPFERENFTFLFLI